MSFSKKNFWFGVFIFAAVIVVLAVFYNVVSKKPTPSLQEPSPTPVSSVETLPYQKQPFSAVATIHLEGSVIVADIGKTEQNILTLTVKEPQVLSGLVCRYNGSDVLLGYNNMEVNLSDNSLVSKAATLTIFSAINASTTQTGLAIEKKDGMILLSGTLSEGDFSLQIDQKTGSLLQLSIPSLDLECSFSDFTFLQ